MGGNVGELVFRSMSSGTAPPVKHFGIQPMMLLRETRALHLFSLQTFPVKGQIIHVLGQIIHVLGFMD